MTDPVDKLRRYADSLRSEMPEERTHRRVGQAMAAAERRRHPRWRMALASGTAAVIANVGLAAAAQPAVPGDILYGVDRAYEKVTDLVGLSDGHDAERIAEADGLVAAGRPDEAIELLDEVSPVDRRHLEEAIDVLRSRVAASRGTGNGDDISDAAGDVGEEAPGASVKPAPNGPPESTPGHDDPGPPADASGPDEKDSPEGAGSDPSERDPTR